MRLTKARSHPRRLLRVCMASIRKNLTHDGAYGQAKSRRIVNGALIFSLGLASCSFDNNVRYAGSLTVGQGDCGPAFGKIGKSTATLMLRGKDAEFVPTDGVVVLRGRVTDSGHLVAESATIGADHKPFAEIFEGDVTDTHVIGQFGSPRCRASVELTRR